MATSRAIAYLHGFASSPKSAKGIFFKQSLEKYGKNVHLPDLNSPSFAKLSISGAMSMMDRLHEAQSNQKTKWMLIGSSLGGLVASLWAQNNPNLVDGLVLLCPAFELQKCWYHLVDVEKWKLEGELEFSDGFGKSAFVHYNFFEELTTHPTFPKVKCPVLIMHGVSDQTIPIQNSREFQRLHKQYPPQGVQGVQPLSIPLAKELSEKNQTKDNCWVELVELNDDHSLMSSLDILLDKTTYFFDLIKK